MSWSYFFGSGCSNGSLGCALDPEAGFAQRPGPAKPHGSPCCEMLIDIDFLDEAHGRSNRSVTYLNGARLKRSLES
jgi:hypothetical protein